MGVTVRYMSQLKAAAGTGEEQIDLETPCPLSDLFDQLGNVHGDMLKRLLCDASGQPQPTLIICIGDKQIAPGDNAQLSDGDEVTLMTPISGG